MRRHLATITFLALLTACLHPALGRAETTPHGPAEREGRTGLVFGFDGERLSAFDGALFALRRQTGQRTGLRLGLSLGFGDASSEVRSLRETELIFPDSTVTDRDGATDVIDSQRVDLEVDLLLIRHARSRHPVGFFYGAGPLIAYERQERTQQAGLLEDDGSRERTIESSETTWRWGVRLVAGIEWFITDAISVHAEYRVGLVYSDQESTSILREVREDETDGVVDQIVTDRRDRESESWHFDSHGARFGVSLFF